MSFFFSARSRTDNRRFQTHIRLKYRRASPGRSGALPNTDITNQDQNAYPGRARTGNLPTIARRAR